jgi:hypothetical protein
MLKKIATLLVVATFFLLLIGVTITSAQTPTPATGAYVKIAGILSQTATLSIPSLNQYVGAFKISMIGTGSSSLTKLVVTERGSV